MTRARPKVLLSWSTGKDSAWALHVLRQEDAVDVVGLLTSVNGIDEMRRVSIHGVRMALFSAQAAAVGLPIHLVPLPDPCTNEDYERAMAAFVAKAKDDGITHIAFGDLFLEDVRLYRETRLAGTGIAPLFPLWGRDTAALAREMLAAGVGARVVSVDREQLDESFLGRRFDQSFLDDLPAGCDPCGERGEFHTFAFAGPAFAHPLDVTLGQRRPHERFPHVEPVAAA